MKNQICGLLTCLTLFGTASANVEFETNQYTWIQDYLTQTSNFPIDGVNFLSYENLLKEPLAFRQLINIFVKRYEDANLDAIIGLDSRGFIFGAALAYELQVPFVMIRKAGKLPGSVERVDYQLEYGKSSFEIQKNSLQPGDKVVIIDDVLATGGTAAAATQLVERLGGKTLEFCCLFELPLLKGREKIEYPVFSLLQFVD